MLNLSRSVSFYNNPLSIQSCNRNHSTFFSEKTHHTKKKTKKQMISGRSLGVEEGGGGFLSLENGRHLRNYVCM